MTIFGWVGTAVGVLLFLVSLGMTMRANVGVRIPFFRNSDIIPSGSITMRSVGAGLLIFGAAALSATMGYWAVMIAFGVPVLAMTMIVIHNEKVKRQPVGPQ